ncbi:SIR2 family protein [Flammeovirga sp. OC4]|uniref:SIR2 family protein n=1 Tax=Flammeovirga sp. OC4 TaxID=1382345 RepID=UPI0035280997
MSPWEPDQKQNIIIDKIRELNAPILTTNFDDLIAKSSNLEFHKTEKKGFTDFYPWSCYHSDRNLENPTDGFGIWYPNGMVKYHRSIKLGLSQYMGNVERARKMIHSNYEEIAFTGKNQNNWIGQKTWLHILFNKSLFILGLGLEENEVFLRWLLIERAKYFQRFPERKKLGWYITTRNESDKNYNGKKFFLESVGIKVIEVENYDIQYKLIWN